VEIIPVLDLKAGQAVHAVRGEREQYTPVQSVLGSGDDPVALAMAYQDRLGCRICYVADLDAITGHTSHHAHLLRTLAGLDMALWIDSGVSNARQAWALANLGVAHIIVGSETLHSPIQLITLTDEFPPDRLILSVDLRSGALYAPTDINTPQQLVALAAQVGINRIILLDLARVGAAVGPPLDLLTSLRPHFPDLAFYAGGGVRHSADLTSLAQAGAAGALVATAFHQGILARVEVQTYQLS